MTNTGFQTSQTKDVQVTVNTTIRTDVALKTGNVSETVTVTDQAPALQTDRADVSAQLQSKQIVELPVGNSRNFQALESLVPGVSPPSYDHSSFFDAQNSQSFNVNGQAETANNLQLEGIDDNERTGLLQVYVPPAAAIQTVDVETSNYTPEFGRSAGSVTNVAIKSGTNDFHGSAYEFNQVSATQARNYFKPHGALSPVHVQLLRGHGWRPDLQEQDVLLRRLSAVHHHQPGAVQPVSRCRPWRSATAI